MKSSFQRSDFKLYFFILTFKKWKIFCFYGKTSIIFWKGTTLRRVVSNFSVLQRKQLARKIYHFPIRYYLLLFNEREQFSVFMGKEAVFFEKNYFEESQLFILWQFETTNYCIFITRTTKSLIFSISSTIFVETKSCLIWRPKGTWNIGCWSIVHLYWSIVHLYCFIIFLFSCDRPHYSCWRFDISHSYILQV